MNRKRKLLIYGGGQFGPPRDPGICSENSVGIWKDAALCGE